MDKEKAIEILDFYKEIDREISIYRRITHDYEKQYYNTMKAMENDGQPKGKNSNSRPVEIAALNVPDHARKDIESCKKKINLLQIAKSQIIQEISRLKMKEKIIIFDYYIYGMKWEQVAEHSNYSVRQCRNIRDAAVEKLAAKFQDNDFLRKFRT